MCAAWEVRADAIVSRAKHLPDQSTPARTLTRVMSAADDVLDSVEEAAYLMTLLPASAARLAQGTAVPLADLLSRAVKAYVRCVEQAQDLERAPGRAAIDAVLLSVEQVVDLEHDCDRAERAAKARLVETAADFRELHVLSEIVTALESAADAAAKSSLLLRDFALGEALVTP
jgi:uncharacterized protein Yka (UPF0111/DUF47 family)